MTLRYLAFNISRGYTRAHEARRHQLPLLRSFCGRDLVYELHVVPTYARFVLAACII